MYDEREDIFALSLELKVNFFSYSSEQIFRFCPIIGLLLCTTLKKNTRDNHILDARFLVQNHSLSVQQPARFGSRVFKMCLRVHNSNNFGKEDKISKQVPRIALRDSNPSETTIRYK